MPAGQRTARSLTQGRALENEAGQENESKGQGPDGEMHAHGQGQQEEADEAQSQNGHGTLPKRSLPVLHRGIGKAIAFQAAIAGPKAPCSESEICTRIAGFRIALEAGRKPAMRDRLSL
jgi:hypothetical protein